MRESAGTTAGAAAPLSIAVVGCGAMGSVYAGRLGRAGHRVIVVDRGADHVAAITSEGLRICGPDGDFGIRLPAYTFVPDEPVDLVVLAVKAAGVAAAARSLSPLLGADTIVLTIQNGLGSADIVAEHVGPDRLAVGIASGFGAARTGPGRAQHKAMRAIRLGSYAGLPQGRAERVAQAWRAAGFDAEAVSNIAAMQWEKLICNVAYSAPCALTGKTVGEVIDDADLAPISQEAAAEAWNTGRALGIPITVTDPVEFAIAFGRQMPDAKPSALLDHEAHRPSEIGVINGAVPIEAAKAGLRAPVNATLTALVLAAESSWQAHPGPER